MTLIIKVGGLIDEKSDTGKVPNRLQATICTNDDPVHQGPLLLTRINFNLNMDK